MQPNGFTPPQAAYERPKPKVVVSSSDSTVAIVVMDTGEIVRLSITVAEAVPVATLQHDYPGVEFVGKSFSTGGTDYEVTKQDGRELTIEAI